MRLPRNPVMPLTDAERAWLAHCEATPSLQYPTDGTGSPTESDP